MGNKRKVPAGTAGKRDATRRPKPKSLAKQSAKPSAAASSPAIAELDVGYVHYSSSSDDENDGTKPVGDTKRQRRPPSSKDGRNRNRNEMRDVNDDDDGDDVDDSDDDDEMADADPEMVLGGTEQHSAESDVEVTLDFFDPCDDDMPAIAAFLSGWARCCAAATANSKKKDTGSAMSASAVAEIVSAQTRVGTTVRVGDEEAPVGFISCLNVRRHAALLAPLRDALTRRGNAGDGAMAKIVETCFGGRGRFEREKMGLLLCERVVNLPPLVLPKLLEAIFCEIEWAVEDEPTKELQEEYRFGWYLYITEAFIATGDGGEGDEAQQKVGFVKAEDEAWFKYAAHHTTWTLPEAQVEKGGLQRQGMAIIIPSAQVDNVRKMVVDLVGFIDAGNDNDGGSGAEENDEGTTKD